MRRPNRLQLAVWSSHMSCWYDKQLNSSVLHIPLPNEAWFLWSRLRSGISLHVIAHNCCLPQAASLDGGFILVIPAPKYLWKQLGNKVRHLWNNLRHAAWPMPIWGVFGGVGAFVAVRPTPTSCCSLPAHNEIYNLGFDACARIEWSDCGFVNHLGSTELNSPIRSVDGE